jgi:hypothetical protein
MDQPSPWHSNRIPFLRRSILQEQSNPRIPRPPQALFAIQGFGDLFYGLEKAKPVPDNFAARKPTLIPFGRSLHRKIRTL